MATQSKIQLYNEALLLIGANEVSSTTETTPNATLCNRFFESARDFVTVDTRWNSAQTEATLTADSIKPIINDLWSDRSLLPTDPYCLRVLDAYVTGIPINYEVVGRYIYSNDLPCDIRYITRIPDLSAISPGLFQSISIYLAYKIAFPITRDMTVVKDLLALYKDHLVNARVLDAQEGTPITIQANELTDPRIR
jgi:hypothetical protein|tara:strand:- start:37 stop:621 length:585 start_codon:yes stop_codon:yes gene_type:complete